MTSLQALGAVLLLGLSCGSFFHSAYLSPDAPFLPNDHGAVWITNPRPVAPETFFARLGEGTPAVFTRTVHVDRPGANARVRVRALGEVSLEINGRPVNLPPGQRACLKRPCDSPVAGLLAAGENTLRARVLNSVGPPVLHLRLEAQELEIGTDDRWNVTLETTDPATNDKAAGASGPARRETEVGRTEQAVRADDTRPYPGVLDFPTPSKVIGQRPGGLLVLWIAFAAAAALGRRFLPQGATRHLPELALAGLTVFWLVLFVTKFVQVPLRVGYDANFHLQYIHYVASTHTLPLASDGWSMYHPPLFYVLEAMLSSLPGNLGEAWALKLLPFASGLGMVWITYALARRLFPGNATAVLFAVLFAGLLPMNLYMSAYVSNEPLHAFLVGLALLTATRAMAQGGVSLGRVVLLSVVLGLAILTKYTALLVVPVIVFFFAFNLVVAHGVKVWRAVSVALGTLAGVSLLGGWFYVRHWLHFGDPLVWNLDLPGGNTWWQPPGFRTLAYYSGFGESLRHPFFSVFHSFWDAMYSGLWGEGLPPSVRFLAERHPLWRYDLMAAGYLLALPATAILLLGFGRVLVGAFVGPDRIRRSSFNLLVVVIWTVGFSVLSYSLRVPSWGNVKAAYALCLVAPAAICAGSGFSAVESALARRPLLPLRVLYDGWLGTFLTVVVLSYAG